MKKEEMIGKKFGSIEVVGLSKNPDFIIGKCDCGTIKEFDYYSVLRGHSKSCGCRSWMHNEENKIEASHAITGRPRRNIIGQKFGLLTVIADAERRGYAVCKCDCGTIKEIHRGSLTSGRTKSCGCLRYRKSLSNFIAKPMNITHIVRVKRIVRSLNAERYHIASQAVAARRLSRMRETA